MSGKGDDKSVTPSSSSEDEDEEEEEEEENVPTATEAIIPLSSQQPLPLQSDIIESGGSSNNAAVLNRQASRSTEDLFTPVMTKKHKWKVKKSVTKDDSGHTYSSSSTSSASSTTSSSAVAHTSYPPLSAKPK